MKLRSLRLKLLFEMKHLILFGILLSLNACDSTPQSPNNDSNKDGLPHLYLNDTGVTAYSQQFSQRLPDDPVPLALSGLKDLDAPDQDADSGRDIDFANDTDGTGGFSFTKLDASGKALPEPSNDYDNQPWSCVKDNVTGLIWEVKTPTGLQQANYNYTWYQPDATLNGGNDGEANSDPIRCGSYLSSCNTSEYIKAINSINNGKGLCGLKNWRLPLREELRSIVDYGVTSGPMIDTNFFPNAVADDTWTAQTAIYQTFDGSEAWEIHFQNGHSEAHSKNAENVVVRLVHDAL